MLVFTLIFIIISLLVIVLPILFYASNRSKTVQLSDVYKSNYQKAIQKLTQNLNNGLISQEEYDNEHAFLSRAFLKQLEKSKTKPLSRSKWIILTIISALVPIGTAFFYWNQDYIKDYRVYDEMVQNLEPEIKAWVDNIPEQSFDTVKPLNEFTPKMPKGVEENVQYFFPALTALSSAENHTNQKYLKLLANAYANLGVLQPTYDIYTRINFNNPRDFVGQHMRVLLRIQDNNYKLNAELENDYDLLIKNFPKKPTLLIEYAQLLYDNERLDKSVFIWKKLKNELKNDTSGYEKVVDEVITSIGNEIALKQLKKPINLSVHLDETILLEDSSVTTLILNSHKEVIGKINHTNINEAAILTKEDFFETTQKNITPEIFLVSIISEPNAFATKDTQKDSQSKDITIKLPQNNSLYHSDFIPLNLHHLNNQALSITLNASEPTRKMDLGHLIASLLEKANEMALKEFKVTLKLDSNINLQNYRPESAIFIYANIKGESAMPFIAYKIDNFKELSFPLTLTLTDDYRLNTGINLQDIEALDVSALISPSGSVDLIDKTIMAQKGEINRTKRKTTITLQPLK